MLARVVEQPVAPPSQCKGCMAGSLSDREWWLDTGTFEEFYGKVYYCNICMTEIAELCGFLGPVRRKALETELKEANARLEELKESITALASLGIDISALSGFVSSHYVSLEGEEGKLDSVIARAAIASEQIDEQRSANVSDPKSRKPKLALS